MRLTLFMLCLLVLIGVAPVSAKTVVGVVSERSAAAQGELEDSHGGVDVDAGRELPEVPPGVGEAGSGYESMGRVYRDPETGEMILMGGEE